MVTENTDTHDIQTFQLLHVFCKIHLLWPWCLQDTYVKFKIYADWIAVNCNYHVFKSWCHDIVISLLIWFIYLPS